LNLALSQAWQSEDCGGARETLAPLRHACSAAPNRGRRIFNACVERCAPLVMARTKPLP